MTLQDLHDERKGMQERIHALINFDAGDPARNDMGNDEMFALQVQLRAMRQYLKALDYRIEQWTKRETDNG